jgi:hypothetical protein
MEEMQAGRRAPRLLMDAYRRGDEFIVHFDLSGVDTKSIDLTTEENVLTVSAQRTYEPHEEDEILMSERREGSAVSCFSERDWISNPSPPPTIRASLPSRFPWRSGPSPAGSKSAEAEALRQSKPRPLDPCV